MLCRNTLAPPISALLYFTFLHMVWFWFPFDDVFFVVLFLISTRFRLLFVLKKKRQQNCTQEISKRKKTLLLFRCIAYLNKIIITDTHSSVVSLCFSIWSNKLLHIFLAILLTTCGRFHRVAVFFFIFFLSKNNRRETL